jgi:hypothetical protein
MAEFTVVVTSNSPKLQDRQAVERVIARFAVDRESNFGTGVSRDTDQAYLVFWGYEWPEAWPLQEGTDRQTSIRTRMKLSTPQAPTASGNSFASWPRSSKTADRSGDRQHRLAVSALGVRVARRTRDDGGAHHGVSWRASVQPA